MAPRFMTASAPAVSNTENRKHQRLDIRVSANVAFNDGIQYNGKTRNISFCGAFIQFNQASVLKRGARCMLTLMFSDGPKTVMLKFKSKITHVKPDGIGLVFKGIFAEDYADFVYLMSKHSPDPDALLRELKENPCIKIHSI
ncbi:MAG TPA: PilZ domain-containing protein [Gammaproteobacteria bacterium]